MDRRDFVVSAFTGMVGLSLVPRTSAQTQPIRPDLGELADRTRLLLFNRHAGRLDEGARTGVRLNAASGEGVAFIPGSNFTYGAIALDVRGKDVPQQSFVGVAFHGVDGAVHDAIYFRPFNFQATDPVSRSHAVQYHSMPAYAWQKLRSEKPGAYEAAVSPVPDPNDWFRVRVTIEDPKVAVYVGDSPTPCLTVDLLNTRRQGLIGLWVGNNSGGDFANLVVSA
jgi:hypothetical protein